MDLAGIYARESSALDRAVQIGVVSSKLISVSFPETVPDDADPDHEYLDSILAALDGDDVRMTATSSSAAHQNDTRSEDVGLSEIPIGLTVPTAQRSVLEALRNVPRGDTVDISLLVRMAGLDPEDDESPRIVRTALAENPVPVVVPDHRVTDGPSAAPAEVVEALRRAEGI
ncbi:MGMT family protein [Haloferax sp. S1W]|uniref:MGMT family protein n=1 Tax=Haloferax sp. S1W TaxID=3377110 RepID=UPI0037CC7D00